MLSTGSYLKMSCSTKVTQILYSGLGGHGSVALSIIDGLPSGRYKFSLGFLGVEPVVSSYKNYCQNKDIKFKYIKAIAGRPFYSWPKLLLWLYRERPSIIILHSVRAVLPCLVFSFATNSPIIFVEHQANALKTRSDWIVSRIGMRFAKKVVYLTEDYAREVKTFLGPNYVPEKVSVIPNGIDTQKFYPLKKSFQVKKRITLGMAARFTNKRRHDLLVAIAEMLIQRAPEFDWHVSLAGSGGTLEQIRSLVVEKGLVTRVSLVGYLDEKKLIEWFHGLDIYVHATEGETLSTSILQAMACSLPIVASNVPGVDNIFRGRQEFGYLVNQSPEDFCNCIINLTMNNEKLDSMAKAARHIAETEYGYIKMAKCYDELILNIVNSASC